ncbi:hypothetical protein LAZ67_X001486 [Cordylochernes scorpioides]|uniref:Uncharacterized protein n=1 Tax=Cordylochernes scorpioides TaxID=51811 RepID=A0ABY6LWK9_9ARAC|nr:hypothetical protein LAZ67_X001486 [Cordylochernes scorpioides]
MWAIMVRTYKVNSASHPEAQRQEGSAGDVQGSRTVGRIRKTPENQGPRACLKDETILLRIQARFLTPLRAWRRQCGGRNRPRLEPGGLVSVLAASGGTSGCVWCSPHVPALVINKTGTKGAPTTQSGLLTKQRA